MFKFDFNDKIAKDHGFFNNKTLDQKQVLLDGANNFRDLGGYKTSDGRSVKRGQVFRSDHLADLTDNDQDLFKHLGVKLVCDFRTAGEVEESPNRLPQDQAIKYLHLPVVHGEFDVAKLTEKIKNGDIQWLTGSFMIDGYKKNIDRFAHVWGTVIRRLSEPESRPLIFHCNSGKDRAGTCATLILLVLGVPEETVVHDYLLSNIYLEPWLKAVGQEIQSSRIKLEQLAPILTASRSYVIALIEYLYKTYGSAGNYLKQMAGISEKTLHKLKEDLLE